VDKDISDNSWDNWHAGRRVTGTNFGSRRLRRSRRRWGRHRPPRLAWPSWSRVPGLCLRTPRLWLPDGNDSAGWWQYEEDQTLRL